MKMINPHCLLGSVRHSGLAFTIKSPSNSSSSVSVPLVVLRCSARTRAAADAALPSARKMRNVPAERFDSPREPSFGVSNEPSLICSNTSDELRVITCGGGVSLRLERASRNAKKPADPQLAIALLSVGSALSSASILVGSCRCNSRHNRRNDATLGRACTGSSDGTTRTSEPTPALRSAASYSTYASTSKTGAAKTNSAPAPI
mmetsp:Transcript_44802/g.74349  ORF Transcript_44802/g.74349 Transcript_44802/m.74349 type:complete len:204 (-) Transcript_44802:477-1088(-)